MRNIEPKNEQKARASMYSSPPAKFLSILKILDQLRFGTQKIERESSGEKA